MNASDNYTPPQLAHTGIISRFNLRIVTKWGLRA